MPSTDDPGSGLLASRTSFSTVLNGETIVIQQGQLIDSGDPILKGRESLFQPAELNIRKYTKGTKRSAPRVEAATAAPGQKRG